MRPIWVEFCTLCCMIFIKIGLWCHWSRLLFCDMFHMWYTDCPATLDTLCEGYYWGVGGPTGQVVVHSGRGRFAISFEVSWPHLSWWEGFQKSSQKLKNRVFGIFCTPGQMPNLHNKVPFFYFFPFMGLREIDTNVIGHHEFGILGTSQTFSW